MKMLLLIALMPLTVAVSAQTRESAIGCWKMAGRDAEAIQVNRAGDFSFSDLNKTTNSYETLDGTWTLAGNKLTFLYTDRPKQTFTLGKDPKGRWTLKKAGGFLFAKATPAECNMDDVRR